MAKNSDVYKTAQERAEAFRKWYVAKCHAEDDYVSENDCFEWLDLEAEEEKPLPCIWCKGEVKCHRIKEGDVCICTECGATAPIQPTKELAIEMYNRVANAVREVEWK